MRNEGRSEKGEENEWFDVSMNKMYGQEQNTVSVWVWGCCCIYVTEHFWGNLLGVAWCHHSLISFFHVTSFSFLALSFQLDSSLPLLSFNGYPSMDHTPNALYLSLVAISSSFSIGLSILWGTHWFRKSLFNFVLRPNLK